MSPLQGTIEGPFVGMRIERAARQELAEPIVYEPVYRLANAAAGGRTVLFRTPAANFLVPSSEPAPPPGSSAYLYNSVPSPRSLSAASVPAQPLTEAPQTLHETLLADDQPAAEPATVAVGVPDLASAPEPGSLPGQEGSVAESSQELGSQSSASTL